MSSDEKNNNNNNENNTVTNKNNNDNQNTTAHPSASDEKHNLLNAPPKPEDENLNLPSYEEAVSFSLENNLEGDGQNQVIESSFYIPPQQNQQSYSQFHSQSVPTPQQPVQAPGNQTKVKSTYLQATSNNSSISYLQGQPSRPINVNAYPIATPNTSFTQPSNPNGSFLQGQPSRPINANDSFVQNQQPTNPNGSFIQNKQPDNANNSFLQGQPSRPINANGSYVQGQPPLSNGSYVQGQPGQPGQPPLSNGSYVQGQPGQPGQPPVSNGSYVQGQPVTQGSTYYPNQSYYVQPPGPTNTGSNIYPTIPSTSPPGTIQYGVPIMPYNAPTLPRHRFDPNQPESVTNYNFETCYDGEYQDMNANQLISTGVIGSRKTEVKFLARVNTIRSSIGLSVVDIRGARILNGESQIIFDGTIGKIILVVPLYCSLTINDSYCIGEVFSHRPCEVPVNEAMQKGLPIIRVMVKNTVGDINIIEKEYNVNVTSESLNNEFKKLKKNFYKKNKHNKQNNGNNDNNGTTYVSMKSMLMKNFNNAKQQLSGNPSNKPVNVAPYPQPGQTSQYPYPMPTPYGAPVQMPQPQQAPYGPSSTYNPSSQTNTPYINAPYPYQGYQPPQQNYYNSGYPTSISNPNLSTASTAAPAPYGTAAPAPTSYGSISAPNSTTDLSSKPSGPASTTGTNTTSYLTGTPMGGSTPTPSAPVASVTTPTTSSTTKPVYPYPPRE